MKNVFLSIGLIHRFSDETSLYLLRKKDRSNYWSPVVGQRLEKESFRETIIREIGWELNLDRKRDFLVSNMSIGSHEFKRQENGEEKHFAIAFYHAKIFSKQARSQILQDNNLRWVTSADFCKGKAGKKDEILPEIVDWINTWKIINPW